MYKVLLMLAFLGLTQAARDCYFKENGLYCPQSNYKIPLVFNYDLGGSDFCGTYVSDHLSVGDCSGPSVLRHIDTVWWSNQVIEPLRSFTISYGKPIHVGVAGWHTQISTGGVVLSPPYIEEGVGPVLIAKEKDGFYFSSKEEFQQGLSFDPLTDKYYATCEFPEISHIRGSEKLPKCELISKDGAIRTTPYVGRQAGRSEASPGQHDEGVPSRPSLQVRHQRARDIQSAQGYHEETTINNNGGFSGAASARSETPRQLQRGSSSISRDRQTPKDTQNQSSNELSQWESTTTQGQEEEDQAESASEGKDTNPIAITTEDSVKKPRESTIEEQVTESIQDTQYQQVQSSNQSKGAQQFKGTEQVESVKQVKGAKQIKAAKQDEGVKQDKDSKQETKQTPSKFASEVKVPVAKSITIEA